MNITFHGGARTVTGSKHLITTDFGKRILLDCGMFQGLGLDTHRLNREFGFDAQSIDIVILSHAHIDHSGLLPKLVKEGFAGKIYCTPATKDFTEVLLRDSAYIQEMDVRHANKKKRLKNKEEVKPLYGIQDAALVFPQMVELEYDTPKVIDENITLLFKDAGHILGSASVHLTIKENDGIKQIAFSGDVGRYNDDLLKIPDTFPQADYIILESTYGDELHPAFKPSLEQLLTEIENTCLHKGGKLIIPAFSVGRTQELLYALNQLELEGRLPKLHYYLDSPMSIEITEITKNFPHLFNHEVQDVLKVDRDPFDFHGLKQVEDVAESKSLNFSKEACVIISASGMAEAGRVKHHIMHNITNPKNTILLVGYAEPESLAGRLRNGNKQVSIYGDKFEVNADISIIDSLSAHGDYADLLKWLSCQESPKVKKLFLVHGEIDVQLKFKTTLEHFGFSNVAIPMQNQSFENL